MRRSRRVTIDRSARAALRRLDRYGPIVGWVATALCHVMRDVHAAPSGGLRDQPYRGEFAADRQCPLWARKRGRCRNAHNYRSWPRRSASLPTRPRVPASGASTQALNPASGWDPYELGAGVSGLIRSVPAEPPAGADRARPPDARTADTEPRTGRRIGPMRQGDAAPCSTIVAGKSRSRTAPPPPQAGGLHGRIAAV